MIGTPAEVNKIIQDAITKSLVDAKNFLFPLSSGLISERIEDKIAGAATYAVYYSPARTIHPSMAPSYTDKGIVVALAHIDKNNNITVVPFEETEKLNDTGYYAKVRQQNENIIKQLTDKLTKQLHQGEFTNANTQEIMYKKIEDFLTHNGKLPSVIKTKERNGFIMYYADGKDLAAPCGFNPPSSVLVAMSTGKGVYPPCISVISPKEMNIITDCLHAKITGQVPTAFLIYPKDIVDVLTSEEERRRNLQENFNEKMSKHSVETYEKPQMVTEVIGKLPDNIRAMYYKEFEKNLTNIINGQPSTLNPNDVTVDVKGNIYYQNINVGIVTPINDSYTVTLTSSGLSLIDTVTVTVPKEPEPFNNETQHQVGRDDGHHTL